MKIICLKGGLGNQMFEFCRYKMLQEKSNQNVYIFYNSRQLKQHQHLLISDCFDVKMSPCPLWVSATTYLIMLLRLLHIKKHLYDDERDDCILIDDYSQDKKYIQNAKSLFTFRPTVSDENIQYQTLIRKAEFPVAIHIRRGDYMLADNLKDFGVCSSEYYQQAISKVTALHPEAQFFLFSDDIVWTQQHITPTNAIYVEHQEGVHDYIDLYLMTLCKAHIIANSTFSFWGSMLADHEEHLCIYPKHWYANPQWIAPDIFPSHWIAL